MRRDCYKTFVWFACKFGGGIACLLGSISNQYTKKKPKFKECITKATDTKPWLIVYRRTYNFVTVRIGIVIYIGRFVVEGILISKA